MNKLKKFFLIKFLRISILLWSFFKLLFSSLIFGLSAWQRKHFKRDKNGFETDTVYNITKQKKRISIYIYIENQLPVFFAVLVNPFV